jgi:putative transposase
MYLTDLEETQWQVIKKILKPQERKRKYDLHKIWNAIFYVVKTGCQWRMLPSDFPSWELVYYYYRKWSSLGEFYYYSIIYARKYVFLWGKKPKLV